MMTPRDRVLALLEGRSADRVPWMGDLEDWVTAQRLSGELPRGYLDAEGLFRLHRDVGMACGLHAGFPFRADSPGVQVRERTERGRTITEVITPVGSLRRVVTSPRHSWRWETVEPFVKCPADLRALRCWCEATSYTPWHAVAEARQRQTGTLGVVFSFLPRSPLMEMVALYAGMDTVRLAIADTSKDLVQTLAVMEERADQAAALALASPADFLMIPEDPPADLVSPEQFCRFLEPHEARWVRRAHGAGKRIFLRLGGGMVLPHVAAVGFDGIEGVASGVEGDTDLEGAATLVPGPTVLWGGLCGTWFTDLVREQIFEARVLSVLRACARRRRCILGVAGGLPPSARLDRIRRVSELVEAHGRYEEEPRKPEGGGPSLA